MTAAVTDPEAGDPARRCLVLAVLAGLASTVVPAFVGLAVALGGIGLALGISGGRGPLSAGPLARRVTLGGLGAAAWLAAVLVPPPWTWLRGPALALGSAAFLWGPAGVLA